MHKLMRVTRREGGRASQPCFGIAIKEELKVDYSKGHCNYLKTIPSLKQQLDGR